MTPSTERLPVLLAELRQVLEEERSILLSGSPEGIAELVKRKLSLAEEIDCTQPRHAELAFPIQSGELCHLLGHPAAYDEGDRQAAPSRAAPVLWT